MEEIIPKIPRKKIIEELTPDKCLRETNFAGNKIYSFTGKDAPNLLKEVGRLREVSFREAGGGTGKEMDLDEHDTSNLPYHQLIVWDPKEEEILGGYRYFLCSELNADRKLVDKHLSTSSLFNFSDKFIKEYLPYTIELGRSFVQPIYQSSRLARKGMFALDNLWDGLGALYLQHVHAKYFFGKVTMYLDYPRAGRDMILYFLHKHFPDNDKLVTPKVPLVTPDDVKYMAPVFTGGSYEEDYKILSSEIRALDLKIPPLINSYMGLSPTMKTFGTASNHAFGAVEETGIMITNEDIYEKKMSRHIVSYIRDNLRIKPLHLRHIRVRFPNLFREGILQARKKKEDEENHTS